MLEITEYLTRNYEPLHIPQVSKITESIYVSNTSCAMNNTLIKDNEINVIVTLNEKDIQYKFPNVKYIHIPMLNLPNFNIFSIEKQFYYSVYKSIFKNTVDKKINILIHSQRGISRPIIMLATYYIKRYLKTHPKTKMTEKKINSMFKFIHRRRQCARPNAGFIEQLYDFYLKS